MSPLDDLVNSMSAIIVDPEGPAGRMDELTSKLAQISLRSDIRSHRVSYYYALNLAEIPSAFKALSQVERADGRVQAVLRQYSLWFDAEDTELLFEALPKDAWTLDILSRAMVEMIVTRARTGDARMPPCAPQDHPDSPFWSRPDDDRCAKKMGGNVVSGSNAFAGQM